MNHLTPSRISAVFLATSLFLGPGSVFPQGSLSPPGAPAPTMKALDQVASTGIAMNATNTPGDVQHEFVISSAGSYYLTGNLAVDRLNGIRVTASGVTIDLNGFQISRLSGTVGIGIKFDSSLTNCVVTRGSITGFATGIEAAGTRGGTFRQIVVSGCTSVGLSSGEGWRIEECSAIDNAGTGIVAAASCQISNCVAANNGDTGFFAGTGSAFSHCTSNNNTNGNPFNAGEACTLTNCTAVGNSGSSLAAILVGPASTIVNCAVNSNQSSFASSYGIYAGNGSVVVGCTVKSTDNTSGNLNNSTGGGIYLVSKGVIKDCAVLDNEGDGILTGSGGLITGCLVSGNGNAAGGSGISGFSGTSVRNCEVTSNSRYGIALASDSLVIDNLVRGNGSLGVAAGIFTAGGTGSRVEGNSLRGNNGTGILASIGDVVIRNSVGGSTTNYNPSSGVNFGPIQSPSTATNPMANISF